jgi:GT2 family glycosyltransferase/glycosyltransferase involved in cell wall biosynthesis
VAEAELPSIEVSRRLILDAIGAPADLTLVSGARAVGDELAAAGARALLGELSYRELALEQLPRARGHTVLLAGGGFSSRGHDIMRRALAVAAMRFERVVALPSSFDCSEEAATTLAQTRALVFASEPESYRWIAPLCEAQLAHDCSFFFDFSPYQRDGRGVLNAFGTYGGPAATPPLPAGNDDISLTAADLEAWLEAIAAHEVVRTDHTHVMIAAALMGKRVEYAPGADDALEAIVRSALAGYAVTRIESESDAVDIEPAQFDAGAEETLQRLRAAALQSPPPSARSEPRVTAVVLTRDRPRLLLRTLDSLERSEVPLHALVLDNGSAPGTWRALGRSLADRPGTTVQRFDRNLGSAEGRKRGTELADSEFVLFLDDDAELLPGALAHLLSDLDDHPDAGAVTATVVRPDGTIVHSGGSIEVTDELVSFTLQGDGTLFEDAALPETGPSGWAPLTAILARKELLEEFPFDCRMRPYFVDNEWNYRVSLSRAGPFRRSREALVLHHLERKHVPGADFASRSAMADLLAAYARFYQLHVRLLGPWLFDHVPELRASDGSCDLAAARLLMELVLAKGTDWTFMAWMNGELDGLLGARRRLVAAQQETKGAKQLLEQARAQAAELQVAVEPLRARIAQDEHTIASLDAALNAANRRARRVEGSVTWQLFQRLRGLLFALLGGEDSAGVTTLQRTLRFIGRVLRMGGAVPAHGTIVLQRRRLGTGPISFPEADQPGVSIIIPLHAHARLTRAALESIHEHTRAGVYEVILVDDAADPETKKLLERVQGAQIIVNERNIGYLHSVHRGAAAARGRWLVLCNNDIEVQPGWLSAMLDCAESRPDVGIVSPKFLYPDGRLSEAGGIIWSDGTGENYGRCDDPACCHYEYRREIDYGSAAALMVTADLWREVGGFDERFEPMYFEDADLCFAALARGLRVMYEPRAHVMHVEGATAGVDEGAGHKRSQAENRPKFVEKWRARLEREHLPNDRRNLWIGANLRREHRVLVVDHRVPTWDRDSGGLRMRGVLEALIKLGCHVSLLPDNLMPMQPYTRELQRMGVEILYGVDIPGMLKMIGPHLSLVILSRPDVAGRWLELLRERAPNATVAFDTVDLHWVREQRRAAVLGPDGGNGKDPAQKAIAMRELELALIRATDATIVVTDDEREQVLADVPDATVHVVPNVNEVRVPVPSAGDRDGVLFVGGFEHDPNLIAAMSVAEEIMPLVWRELPELKVTFAGADPPPELRALASPRVDVRGWIPDLDPVLDSARAMIAPLKYGAGMKGKVTQALAAGLPVVTTSIGAEGLDAVDGEHLLIAESAAELAAGVVSLCRDDELWHRLSRSGQQLAAERCSSSLMVDRLNALLEEVVVGSRAKGSRLGDLAPLGERRG